MNSLVRLYTQKSHTYETIDVVFNTWYLDTYPSFCYTLIVCKKPFSFVMSLIPYSQLFVLKNNFFLLVNLSLSDYVYNNHVLCSLVEKKRRKEETPEHKMKSIHKYLKTKCLPGQKKIHRKSMVLVANLWKSGKFYICSVKYP